MEKKNVWRPVVIVIGIIFLISFSDEMATMAKEFGFLNALGSFILITLIILGARYWIRRSKKAK